MPSEVPPRCLSVVVPMYNEAGTLAEVLEKILAQEMVGEVILVDDGSSDDTAKVAKEWEAKEERIRFIAHDINQGKGAALRTGFQSAKLPYVIVQDADLEYDPSEFEKVIAPLAQDRADVVYGSRYLKKDTRNVLRFWHTMGNRFLTLLSNMTSDLHVTDMETCYKGFRREVIQAIKIEENRFGFEPEVTAKLAKMNLRTMETSVSYYPRSYDEGKKIGWKDGVRAIFCIVKYNLIDREATEWQRSGDE
ncbi:glycosyltransferase family 2 protein [Akkermansiaceae bacterium]|nr:glycosyltransferase family 2 protein [Akkermansiaceae bacterium]